MSSDDVQPMFLALLIGVILGAGCMYMDTYSKISIVNRGAAYYHPTTGEFTWHAGNVILKGLDDE